MSELGALVALYVSQDARVPRVHFLNTLQVAGCDLTTCPRPRGAEDALRMALQELSRQILPSPGPEQTAEYVIAPVKGARTWHVHVRVTDMAGRQVGYEHVARVQHDGSLTVNDPAGGPLPDMLAFLVEARDGYMRDYVASDLRTLAENVLERAASVTVRPSVRFVRTEHLPAIRNLQKALQSLPEGRVTFSVYTLADNPENRQSLAGDLSMTFSSALESLSGAILKARLAEKLSPATVKALRQSLTELELTIATSSDLLEGLIAPPGDLAKLQEQVDLLEALG